MESINILEEETVKNIPKALQEKVHRESKAESPCAGYCIKEVKGEDVAATHEWEGSIFLILREYRGLEHVFSKQESNVLHGETTGKFREHHNFGHYQPLL